MSQPYRATNSQSSRSGTENAPAYPPASLRPQSLSASTLASNSGLARPEGASTLPPLSSLAGYPGDTAPRPLAEVTIPTRSPERQRAGAEYYAHRNPLGPGRSSGAQQPQDPSHQRQGPRAASSTSSRSAQLRDTAQYGGAPAPGMMRPQSFGPGFPGFHQTSAHLQGQQSQAYHTEAHSPPGWNPRTNLTINPPSAASASTSPGAAGSSQVSPFQPGFPTTPLGFAAHGQGRESASSSGGLRQTDQPFTSQQAPDLSYTTSSGTQYMTVETAQGPMSFPVDVQGASKIADEKRRRNAGASARFRARRKEKEQANSKEIDDLKQHIRDLGEDVDFYRRERDLLASVLYRMPERDRYFPRPPSPRRHRPTRDYQREYSELPEDSPRRQDTPTFEEHGERGAVGRLTRRRLTGEDPMPDFESAESARSVQGHTSLRPLAGYSYPPTQIPGFAQSPQQYGSGVPRPGPQPTHLPVLSSARSLPPYQPPTSGAAAQHPNYPSSSGGARWPSDPGRR